MENISKKLALIICGGGLKSIVSVMIMKRLDETLKEKLGDTYQGLGTIFDYVAGISSGALIALQLCMKNKDGSSKYTIDDIFNVFYDNAGKFSEDNSLLGAQKFSKEKLKNIIEKVIGNAKFTDENLSAKLLLPSYSLDNSNITIWTNIGTEEQREKIKNHVVDIENIYIKDVAKACSAYPIYSETSAIKYKRAGDIIAKKHYEMDGGIPGTIPALQLLSDIINIDKVKWENLSVLSIGTGIAHFDLSNLANAGLPQYIMNKDDILSSFLHFGGKNDTELARQVLTAHGGSFFELNPPISKIDNAKTFEDSIENAEKFIAIAEDYLEENEYYFNEIVDSLVMQLSMT